MSDPFVAEIRLFPFTFAPTGWAFCNGQLLPISQNTALFSLLGTNYGGDGKSTFGLPDLRGATPVAWGQGPGLSQHYVGEQGGSATVTLLATEMPLHSHPIQASTQEAGARSPIGELFAAEVGVASYAPPGAGALLATQAVGAVGGNQPHNNRPPYLALNFCIALQGIFPPRS